MAVSNQAGDDRPERSSPDGHAEASERATRASRPRREDVRRRLLQAALEVFAERGYERSSLEQVAAAAGFTKGAVYSNFASKDELFLALMDQQVRTRVEHARDALQAVRGEAPDAHVVGDRLTAALTADRNWQLLFLDYVQRAVRDPSRRQQLQEHRRRVRQLIADTIREVDIDPSEPAGSAGTLGADAAATTLLALSNGLAIERYIDPDAVPDQLLGRILQLLRSTTT